MKVQRIETNPLITPASDPSLGDNINGPSLIRVPEWVPNPLGRYYLYFAHHRGTYIRLAYSDAVEGPYQIYRPGVLPLEDSYFEDHIASPDVLIDEQRREIRMYYHGIDPESKQQLSRVAVSKDGLRFSAYEPILPTWYMRAFTYDNYYYAVYMPGRIARSRDGITNWEQGPRPSFATDLGKGTHLCNRHFAVLRQGNTLYVFVTRMGDTPERILVLRGTLHPDWTKWSFGDYEEVMRPETDYEGADLPVITSRRGPVHEREHALRDPGIFEEDGKYYLLYAIAGESGLAMARLEI